MNILGLMSGTSLDGVDLALCHFDADGYRILAATTVPYTDAWRSRLSQVEQGSALDLARTHTDLGHHFGQLVHWFLEKTALPCDAVASHGHTIFHQPELSLTTQIGCPNALAAECGLPVGSDFRTLDVALGGQGAPLVPLGDELLFADYDACLNLGGIANISYCSDGQRIAYDICPCNMVLNRLATDLGLPFDNKGENAARGSIDYYLQQTLDRLDYYRLHPPKSLGKEWVINTFWPAVASANLPVTNALRTVTDHIARQVAQVVQRQHIGTLLITGGGAYNDFLVGSIAALVPSTQVVIPNNETIDYKEALIFALLGYRRLQQQVNTLCSVTGARADSIGGTISAIPPAPSAIGHPVA